MKLANGFISGEAAWIADEMHCEQSCARKAGGFVLSSTWRKITAPCGFHGRSIRQSYCKEDATE